MVTNNSAFGEIPVVWVWKGNNLYTAARVLESKYELELQSTPINRLYDNLHDQSYMLGGMALECWFKGALLTKSCRVPFVHNLAYLAEKLQIAISENERRLMECLTEAIFFFGRYPADKKGIGGDYLLTGDHHSLIKSIAEKIIAIVPPTLAQQFVTIE